MTNLSPLQELDLIFGDLGSFERLIYQLISNDQEEVSKALDLFDLALRDRPESLLLALSTLLSSDLLAEAARHRGIFARFFSSIFPKETTFVTFKSALLSASNNQVINSVRNHRNPLFQTQYILRLMILTLTEALNSAGTDPRFSESQLEEELVLMRKIIVDDSLEVKIKRLAIEFVMALAENAPSMVSREPEFIEELFGKLMDMLVDVEGLDDAAAANAAAANRAVAVAANYVARVADNVSKAAARAAAAARDVVDTAAAANDDADAANVDENFIFAAYDFAFYAAADAAAAAASVGRVKDFVAAAAAAGVAAAAAAAAAVAAAADAAAAAADAAAADAAAAAAAAAADAAAVVAPYGFCIIAGPADPVFDAARDAISNAASAVASAARAADAAFDSNGFEVDSFCETRNYKFGKKCLSKFSILLGERPIFLGVIHWFSELLGSSIWQQRHAALIAIQTIAESCHEVMLEKLDEIVPEVLNSLNDLHPYVQSAAVNAIRQLSVDLGPEWATQYHEIVPGVLESLQHVHPSVQLAAINAITQLSVDFHPELQTQDHENVLNRLDEVMKDFLRPELQAAAFSAALSFLKNVPEDIRDLKKWKIIDEFRKFVTDNIFIDSIFIDNNFVGSELVKIVALLERDIRDMGRAFKSLGLYLERGIIDGQWSEELREEYLSRLHWLLSLQTNLERRELDFLDRLKTLIESYV